MMMVHYRAVRKGKGAGSEGNRDLLPAKHRFSVANYEFCPSSGAIITDQVADKYLFSSFHL